MAVGDLVLFNEAKLQMLDGTHDLDTDTFRGALLTNTTNPTAADVAPALSSYTEVSVGGTYVAGGAALSATLTESAGTVTFDFTTNPSWAQDANNPTNAYWLLVYNNTNAGKEALGYVDLGGPVDMTAGALTITWNASGFFTLA